jgi:hypothetical protein
MEEQVAAVTAAGADAKAGSADKLSEVAGQINQTIVDGADGLKNSVVENVKIDSNQLQDKVGEIKAKFF